MATSRYPSVLLIYTEIYLHVRSKYLWHEIPLKKHKISGYFTHRCSCLITFLTQPYINNKDEVLKKNQLERNHKKKLLLKFYYSVGVYSVAAFPHRSIGQGHIEQTWKFYLTKCWKEEKRTLRKCSRDKFSKCSRSVIAEEIIYR
jgi:hypothetical protein